MHQGELGSEGLGSREAGYEVLVSMEAGYQELVLWETGSPVQEHFRVISSQRSSKGIFLGHKTHC